MPDKIRTLLLHLNGVGWKKVIVDTAVRGVFNDSRRWEDLPPSWRRLPGMKALYGQRFETLSYVLDWQQAFEECPALQVESCNINNFIHYFRCLRNIKQYDLIVVLHSAAGDSLDILLKTQRFFLGRKGKLLVFIGNEYNLLRHKRRFIDGAQADCIGSQLPLKAAQWLYEDCRRSQVLETPHALNPRMYFPISGIERRVDIGFIGDIYSYAIGDVERTRIIEYFREKGRADGLNCLIQKKRLPAAQWNEFLNESKGIIGAESGTYYLEKDDRTMVEAQEYIKSHPHSTFEEVYDLFFRNYENPVNGKAISSRHFEPIGTRTCQILVEGEYNNILRPNEHYIAVKKDLSNIEEAIERFKDTEYRQSLVEKTLEYVLAHHTHRHRVESILRTLFQI